MKIRETINSNVERYSAIVYEDKNMVVVIKRNTSNYYDNSTDERITFGSVTDYRAWVSAQDWITPGKVRTVSPFRAVKA